MTDDTDNTADADEQEDAAQTDISAELGDVSITVSSDGDTDTEELFYRVWDYVMTDAEEMSDALQDRLKD